ncbi:MAG: rhodanese-like domain-containing protein [Chitinophagaceae bacterium]|nr:rhodanese-like domain-containing protein [Chitinophagaceae bacterium]
MQIITAEELKQRQAQGESLNILDVREPGEYQEINMGAKLIPLGQILAGQIEDIEAWRDQELIVHCRSGMRSMQACMMLDSLGFSNTKNLAGGILAWQALS